MADTRPQLSLYNTLTRAKAPFVPIDPGNVRMYACGPTVYDFAHIGNGRMAIVFDMVFRLLRQVYGADHVTYVRNITDVDNKINARAVRDFPGLELNEAIGRVTEKTAAQYQKDVRALGCLEPTVQPRATDNIPQMQILISSLLQHDHAYESGGEVLFDVQSMPDYGALSGRALEDNLAGARIAVEEHKKNPADFVLWKQSSAEEPGWESPWGRGRPGWHIECSAMSERYLGQKFDIHGGGLDLIFPHHENEIAQSRCAHGTEVMANVWMHNGFLQVEGEKMSKSLGNFFTIAQLLETGDFGGRPWPGEVLRLAMLMTHYREPIDFSLARLEEAESMLKRWTSLRHEAPEALGVELHSRTASPQPNDAVTAALADDLNTVEAIGEMQRLAKQAASHPQSLLDLASAWSLFGFQLQDFLPQNFVDVGELSALAADRLAALAAKNFGEADRIRAGLLARGIQLLDYKDPETGERKTKWEVR